MAKMLDFNALQHPTLPVMLKDENRTVVHIAPPTVKLLERLQAAVPDLKEVAQQKDPGSVQALYALIADLISCNDDGYVFTGEQLECEYNMSLYDLVAFIRAYFDFIQEINDAKN
jgi:hypothetical protein